MLRSSGFGDLDQAALAAVLESAPLSPLPPEIAPGLDRISLTVPVEFWNPTVH
jgi:TonB family protein